ncbi:hypothetical protein [Actinomadura parmotrematis]|uniref:Uncharacterized protein n=1 Tax=Actinomadura parmotrematis TaxID=2864039 RepID=A0ABS7FNE8_9ACTN|nr:hypothetical protein [Actinomadura parmotrematis]MBW8481909.1 hypothetical protein [Actinomadura parmotrematis]
MSNNAEIAADRVAATLLRALREHPERDLNDLLSRAATMVPQPRPTSHANRPKGKPAPHLELGAFTCDQALGTLRLTLSGDALYLWRRGTAEQLTKIKMETCAGSGYTLTLSGDRSQPDGFVLSLDRAPELPYVRR